MFQALKRRLQSKETALTATTTAAYKGHLRYSKKSAGAEDDELYDLVKSIKDMQLLKDSSDGKEYSTDEEVSDSELSDEEYSTEDETESEAEEDEYVIGEEYRRFGHFECSECSKYWCSARAWCRYTGGGKFKPMRDSKQACSQCDVMVKPYRTDELQRGSGGGGDRRGAHRSDLCQRCLNGIRCDY